MGEPDLTNLDELKVQLNHMKEQIKRVEQEKVDLKDTVKKLVMENNLLKGDRDVLSLMPGGGEADIKLAEENENLKRQIAALQKKKRSDGPLKAPKIDVANFTEGGKDSASDKEGGGGDALRQRLLSMISSEGESGEETANQDEEDKPIHTSVAKLPRKSEAKSESPVPLESSAWIKAQRQRLDALGGAGEPNIPFLSQYKESDFGQPGDRSRLGASPIKIRGIGGGYPTAASNDTVPPALVFRRDEHSIASMAAFLQDGLQSRDSAKSGEARMAIRNLSLEDILHLGENYLVRGEYAMANRVFCEAAEVYPESSEVWSLLAKSEIHLGRDEAAMLHHQVAIRLLREQEKRFNQESERRWGEERKRNATPTFAAPPDGRNPADSVAPPPGRGFGPSSPTVPVQNYTPYHQFERPSIAAATPPPPSSYPQHSSAAPGGHSQRVAPPSYLSQPPPSYSTQAPSSSSSFAARSLSNVQRPRSPSRIPANNLYSHTDSTHSHLAARHMI